ncbi:hypothetical protein LTR37_006976 [Vermiconidia calcicola]|uniref:Uncharacterized protein n=1 Tax=Vermiconidia calcicola TaxID=1690605 RepID=A0ACC3NGC7_9PEZI|nr:hypothetical protein LTR37_006976 [Vermiconidia calcicola]
MDEICNIKSISCGTEAAKYFALQEGYRNLNHGSFGTYPTPVRSVLRNYQDRAEATPDAFIRYEYPERLDESRAAIAKYLHAPIESCVFVPNATTGINTVLRNLVYEPDDVIIYFATIYGACEKTVSYIVETTPAEARKVPCMYPVSDDDLCDAFEDAVRDLKVNDKNPKIAIFDTIVALPGVLAPFERLTQLCKQYDVLSCIDGAHGVGHIPLNLSELGPDFFVSNCHKWLHVPRGCAVFYVPERNQHLMRSTLPTSHGFVPTDGGAINNPLPPTSKSDFVNSFEFVGTLDNSPFLCVPDALEWRSKVTWNDKQGEEAIFAYNLHLARRSGQIVSGILGTEVLENKQGTLGDCNFANVRLPLSFKDLAESDPAKAARIGQWIVKTLVADYQTFIAMVFYDESWWMRLSSSVYLTEHDFEWAGQVLKDVCDRVRKEEWKENESATKL